MTGNLRKRAALLGRTTLFDGVCQSLALSLLALHIPLVK